MILIWHSSPPPFKKAFQDPFSGKHYPYEDKHLSERFSDCVRSTIGRVCPFLVQLPKPASPHVLTGPPCKVPSLPGCLRALFVEVLSYLLQTPQSAPVEVLLWHLGCCHPVGHRSWSLSFWHFCLEGVWDNIVTPMTKNVNTLDVKPCKIQWIT